MTRKKRTKLLFENKEKSPQRVVTSIPGLDVSVSPYFVDAFIACIPLVYLWRTAMASKVYYTASVKRLQAELKYDATPMLRDETKEKRQPTSFIW